MSLKLRARTRLLSAILFMSGIAVCSADSIVAGKDSTIGDFAAGDAFPLTDRDVPQLSRIVFELGSCGPMLRSHWHDPTGRIIAAEELETADDGFVRYRYWRPNVEEYAVVTRSGPSTLRIEFQESDRKVSREVTVDGDVAAGPMMTLLGQRALARIKSGDTVPLRYVVPGKFAAYTFNLARAEPEPSRFGVSVTPDGWMARQFSKSVTLYFDDDGQFQGMRGPTLPVMGTPQRKQALDLDVMVNRRYTRPCSPAPVSNPQELVE